MQAVWKVILSVTLGFFCAAGHSNSFAQEKKPELALTRASDLQADAAVAKAKKIPLGVWAAEP